jgi:hypothetical protein
VNIMKNILTIGLGTLIFLLTIASASAAVDVTYTFDQNNVEAAIFACGDQDCTQSLPFTGTVQSATSNGHIQVSYPTTQQTPYGYAAFFVSDNYIPIHGTVQASGNIVTTKSHTFNQLQNCNAVITSLDVVNEAQQNIPLLIRTQAQLDAAVNSAFSTVQNGVGFIPSQFKEHYSADVDITLNIYDNNNNKVVTNTVSRSVLADATEQVAFQWTPNKEGDYTIEMITQVTDSQCSTTGPEHNVQKKLTVLEQAPANACYTLLNGLTVSDDPQAGDTVNISFSYLNNHADSNGNLQPIDGFVDVKASDITGSSALSTSAILPSTGSTNGFSTQTFSFVAQTAGFYTVEVTAKPNSNACNGLQSNPETVTQTFFVEATDGSQGDTHKLMVTVLDNQNAIVQGAEVMVGGRKASTNSSGIATLDGLVSGTYTFTITKSGFSTTEGTLNMPNNDFSFTAQLFPQDSVAQAQDMEMRIGVSSIRIPNANKLRAGDRIPILIAFTNSGDEQLENMKAVVLLQDLGIRKSLGPMDVNAGERENERVMLEIPANTAPGKYPIRFTLFAKGVKKVVHREIRVI